MNGHHVEGLAGGAGTLRSLGNGRSSANGSGRSISSRGCSVSEIQPAGSDDEWLTNAKADSSGGVGDMFKWAYNAGVRREAAALAINSPWLDVSHPMTPYEWLKLLLMLPMVLIRLAITAVVLPCVYVYTIALLHGCQLNQPLAPWRKIMLLPVIRFWAGVLLRIGFNIWPKYTGLEHIQEAEDARAIVIFNHVSYTDPVVLAEIMMPCGLAKLSVAKIPFFGRFAHAMQFLFVERESRPNGAAHKGGERKGATMAMLARAVDARFPLFAIAPEGTTKAADCLLTFSTGAFVGGHPVLPVLFRYRARHFSLGWGRVQSTLWHFMRLQSQFNNWLEVIVLPVYHPSQQEKQNPRLYAENVRQLMGAHLAMPLNPQGLTQWMMLKQEGICTDWTGTRIIVDRPPIALMGVDALRKEQ